MKIIYLYDVSGYFAGGKQVDATYQLQANETEIKPANDLFDPKWNGSAWVGSTKQDWETQQQEVADELSQKIPDADISPNETEKALAALSYQMMQGQQTTSDLQQANAQTAYQMMQGQQTITDLQTANAQLAYQVMTNGGNA